MTGYMRRSRLAQQLALAQLEEAMLQVSEPQPVDDAQADRILAAARRATVACVHCPDCGTQMQDEGFNFWCPGCKASVSYARVTAEGD